MKKLLTLAYLMLFALSGKAQTDDLMLIEYQDFDPGDGFQVRIYNPTNQAIDLSNYYLQVFNNGNLSASSSSQLSGTLLAHNTILVGNAHSCSSDLVFGVAGVNNNDCIALTLGSGLNFVDMINLYGVDVKPKIDGQTNAMFHHRLLRNADNCMRYTSTDGSSVNSWSNNPNQNNPGWQVLPTGCLSPASGFVLLPSTTTQNMSICEGDSVFLQNAWRIVAGTYYDTLAGSQVCDSVLITHLNLDSAPSAARTFTVCDAGESISYNGQLYGVGSYTAKVSNPSGCDSLIQIEVLHQAPLADFVWEYNPIDSSEIFISNYAVNAAVVKWYFGDGAQGANAAASLSHRYETSGLYTLTLIVANAEGCLDSLSLKVFIPEEEALDVPLYVPNVFSPNGDGINDYYTINAPVDLPHFNFQVYNRWGQLLYESNELGFKWDGTFNGQACAEGVYLYTLETHERKQGFITLVR